ncbi:MAG: nucleotidyltransferase domain-containing protein [Saprospiraceae bacterium]|nr:nucleotidyltransferase domain-containing protein [Saprospiraceae bacterium]MDW8229238.1 nucleotidyltransferase domain-containing protein [Saprospiraceae bacterium]
MELTLAYIKNTLAALKPELHGRFGVSEIGVFGAWVCGEQRADGGIDVLVEFDRPVDLFDVMETEKHLQTGLGHNLDVASRRNLRRHLDNIF